jgi:nucleotide-binding universal stress UspA family protein
MFNSILVATDASAHGYKAVATACQLSAAFGAKLCVVHVTGQGEVPDSVRRLIDAEHLADPPEIEIRSAADLGSGVGYLRTIGETGIRRHQMWEALGKQVIAQARSVAQEHGVDGAEFLIEDGDPVEVLMELVEKRQPDLVVLGRRGVSDLRGLLMGSVSHKISQLAKSDVLTVMAY